MDEGYGIETKAVRAGQTRPLLEGAVVAPVFQSATYESGDETSYHGIRYLRLNNSPNHLALAGKLAALENAESAVVAASGMAAIATALFTVLGSGGHVLAHRTLYGGTHDLLTKEFASHGLSFDLMDADDPGSWSAKLRPTTRAAYVETITNPLLEVCDLEAVVRFAREHELVAMVDNTFASPVNFRPAEHGFDLSLHSGTKYLNGHSDIVAGAVIGRADLVEQVTHRLNHLGGTLDPHACFLLDRGLKTLVLRVRQHNASALALARFLEAHPAVALVHYPGLTGHPQHTRATRLLDGFGGMLSFELHGGLASARQFLQSVELAIVAPSLGSVETLVTRPAATAHLGLSRSQRAASGVTDGLVRVSVGIEALDDLLDDFGQALDRAS